MYVVKFGNCEIHVNSDHVLTVKHGENVEDIKVSKFLEISNRSNYTGIHKIVPRLGSDVTIDLSEYTKFVRSGFSESSEMKRIPISRFTPDERRYILDEMSCGNNPFHCSNSFVREYVTEMAQTIGIQCEKRGETYLYLSEMPLDLVLNKTAVMPFYGFTLDGNGRFIMPSGMVTHNSGKCIGVKTPLMRASGEVCLASEVCVGDELMGQDLKPRKVLAVEYGEGELLNFLSHIYYQVTPDHRLTVMRNGKQVDIYAKDAENTERLVYSDPVESKHDIHEFFGVLENPRRLTYCGPCVTEAIQACVAARAHFSVTREDENMVVTLLGDMGVDRVLERLGNTQGKYVSIQVSDDEHFLLADYTVTHNSTVLKSIFYEKQNIIPAVQVIAGSEDFADEYKEWAMPLYTSTGFNAASYTNMMARQKAAMRHLVNPFLGVIVDDCEDDKKMLKHKLWETTYKKCRHWDILHCYCSQYCNNMPLFVRGNIDVVMIQREESEDVLKRIYSNFGTIVGTFRQFQDILLQVTTDFRALVINSRCKTGKFEDTVFYYEARKDIPKDWKIGCQEFIESNEERYDASYVAPIFD